jgi:hypothetical protein
LAFGVWRLAGATAQVQDIGNTVGSGHSNTWKVKSEVKAGYAEW